MPTLVLDTAFAALAVTAAWVALNRQRLRLDRGSVILGVALWMAGLLAAAHGAAGALQRTLALDAQVVVYLLLVADLLALLGIGLAARHEDQPGAVRPLMRLSAGLLGVAGALGLVEAAIQASALLPPLVAPSGRLEPPGIAAAALPALAGVWALFGERERLRARGAGVLHRPLFAAVLLWILSPVALLAAPPGFPATAAAAAVRTVAVALVLAGLLAEQARKHRESLLRLRDVEGLQGATQALLASLDPLDTSRTVAARAADIAGADAAVLFRLDERVQVFRVVAHSGAVSAEVAAALELPLSRMANAGLTIGRAVGSADLQADEQVPFADDLRARVRGSGLRGLVAVPLLLPGGHVLGALAVLSRRQRPFDRDDVDRLWALGAQATVAIENARTVDRLARRARNDEALQAFCGRLLGVTRASAALADAAGVAREMLGADHAAVFLEDGRALALAASAGWPSTAAHTRLTPSPESLIGDAFVRLASVHVEDLALDRRGPATVALLGEHVRSGIAVPLAPAGGPGAVDDAERPLRPARASGVLVALYRTPRSFNDEDVRALTLLATYTAMALDRVPVADDLRPAPLTPAPAVLTGARSLRARVLVVDDQDDLRDLVVDTLRAAGHEAEDAATGREALQRLQGASYDCVILDLRLPDIDGRAVWQWIVAHRPALAPHVVFMTGDPGVDVQDVIARTTRPVLTKPFALDRVTELLASAVGDGAARLN